MPATTTRQKTAAAASDVSTPSPSSPAATLPKTVNSSASDGSQPTPNLRRDGGGDEAEEIAKCRALLLEMEGRICVMEGENMKLRGEVNGLRDKLEEEVFARVQLEKKLEEIAGKNEAGELTEEREAPKEWRKELEKVEERIMKKVEAKGEQGGGGAAQKRRCVILSDSNGRNSSTPESVLAHIPEESRGNYEVEIIISYHLAEAIDKLKKNEFGVRGAYVVIDCHSNDVRDTRSGPALSPETLVTQLDELRRKLWEAGAAEIVVCAIKPTLRVDVRLHNETVHKYLQQKKEVDGGHGCCTQVRFEHLGMDGIHLTPQYYCVIQNTYACAITGTKVHSPTPLQDFVPNHVRSGWEKGWGWSKVAEGVRALNVNHGWR